MATVRVSERVVPKAREHHAVVCDRSVRNKRLRLKTLGAFTLKVVLSKFRFGSESVSTPMGPRAVTGVEWPGDVDWQTLIENGVERGSSPTIVSANVRKSAAHQSFAISSSLRHRGPAVDDFRTKT